MVHLYKRASYPNCGYRLPYKCCFASLATELKIELPQLQQPPVQHIKEITVQQTTARARQRRSLTREKTITNPTPSTCLRPEHNYDQPLTLGLQGDRANQPLTRGLQGDNEPTYRNTRARQRRSLAREKTITNPTPSTCLRPEHIYDQPLTLGLQGDRSLAREKTITNPTPSTCLRPEHNYDQPSTLGLQGDRSLAREETITNPTPSTCLRFEHIYDQPLTLGLQGDRDEHQVAQHETVVQQIPTTPDLPNAQNNQPLTRGLQGGNEPTYRRKRTQATGEAQKVPHYHHNLMHIQSLVFLHYTTQLEDAMTSQRVKILRVTNHRQAAFAYRELRASIDRDNAIGI